jgi:hypothetical protein
MIFSGQNIRKMTGQKDISFLLQDCSLNNLSGSGEFGFTDGTTTIKFRFEQGNIFDFDNKIVYSYRENNNFTISGDISSTHYSYKITDNESSFIVGATAKSNFELQQFFINTTGCQITTLLKIFSDSVAYDCQAPTTITKGGSINVTVSNQSSNATLHIFNASLKGTSANYFTVNSFTAPLTIAPGANTTIGLTNSTTGIDSTNILLDLDTSIGVISKSFPIDLYTAPVYTATNTLELFSTTDTQTGKEYLYKFSSSVYKDDSQTLTNSGYVDQESTISLEYVSGSIGAFHEVTGVTIDDGGSGYQDPRATFSSGGTYDELATATVSAASGAVNSVTMRNQGNYFQNAPTVTFSDYDQTVTSNASGTVVTSTYDKKFTNCFDMGTNTDPLSIQVNFLSQGLTQNQGDVTYDFANYGPGMYQTSSATNVANGTPLYIKVVYTDKSDAHAISAKLKIVNLYPDSNSSQTAEEATISVSEPAPTTTSTTTSTTTTTTTTTAAPTTTTTAAPTTTTTAAPTTTTTAQIYTYYKAILCGGSESWVYLHDNNNLLQGSAPDITKAVKGNNGNCYRNIVGTLNTSATITIASLHNTCALCATTTTTAGP